MTNYKEIPADEEDGDVPTRVYERKIDAIHAYARVLHDVAVCELIASKSDWDDLTYRDALIHESKIYFEENDASPCRMFEKFIVTYEK